MTPRERLAAILQDPSIAAEDVLASFGGPPGQALKVLRGFVLDPAHGHDADRHLQVLLALRAAQAGTNGRQEAAKGLTAKPSTEAVVVPLSSVKIEPVRWLWESRLALSKLSLVAGNAGVGKSLLAATLAAHVSRGMPWPDGSGKPTPGSVLLLSGEDGPADTIKPRIVEAGGDPERVAVLEMIRERDDRGGTRDRGFSLVHDLPPLEAALGELQDPKLVVVDPVSAYLGGVDSHRDADVRGVLTPLAKLAERSGVAVLLIAHHRKTAAAQALHAVSGSVAFGAAVRTAFVLAPYRDDANLDDANPDDANLLVLAPTKSNLARLPPSLGLRIKDGRLAPRLDWTPGALEIDADKLLAEPSEDRDGGKEAEAEAFLREELADGPRPAREVFAAADEACIRRRTLKRAKRKLGVQSRKGPRGWEWRLPEGQGGRQGGQGGQLGTLGTLGTLEPSEGPPDPPEARDWTAIEAAAGGTEEALGEAGGVPF